MYMKYNEINRERYNGNVIQTKCSIKVQDLENVHLVTLFTLASTTDFT